MSNLGSDVSPFVLSSSMADVAIHACALLAMTVYAPTHRLVHLSAHTMHLADLAVTVGTVDAGHDMRLMGEEDIGRLFHPIDALPGRFLLLLEDGRNFLNFRTIGLRAFVAGHACANAGDCGVAGFICVLMAEDAFELRAVLFGEVLPVIELNRLQRRLAAGKDAY